MLTACGKDELAKAVAPLGNDIAQYLLRRLNELSKNDQAIKASLDLLKASREVPSFVYGVSDDLVLSYQTGYFDALKQAFIIPQTKPIICDAATDEANKFLRERK